ncbi:hypothetical protein sync_1475 [Synechococcus sp. CC9311]|nr:hypothetical protein sync_1475 [Synechococcus sp. CC9311]
MLRMIHQLALAMTECIALVTPVNKKRTLKMC